MLTTSEGDRAVAYVRARDAAAAEGSRLHAEIAHLEAQIGVLRGRMLALAALQDALAALLGDDQNTDSAATVALIPLGSGVDLPHRHRDLPAGP